jgi:8-oxo-dGTP pyrophosphatase MutT (NUDIX family)
VIAGMSPERAEPRPKATPKPAATVVLLRDRSGGGIETFLVQRQGSMGFMGGVHVFPGGKVSETDRSERMRARVLDAAAIEADRCWGEGLEPEAAWTRAVAAVRETFEEAGVLIAGARAYPSADDLARMRERLQAGEDFAELLAAADLTLQLRALRPFARWITPESEPVRFDTSFYVACAPQGQQASHDEHESASSAWLSPYEALESADAGSIRLAPPTARTLEAVRDAASTADALALAASRPPPVVLPLLRTSGDETVVLYPGDPEHPVSVRAFDGPTRTAWRRK